LAIDTEFHREGTYFPKVALIQIAWSDDNVALLDPLSCDLQIFSELFETDIQFVMHASAQDLEVFHRICGKLPKKLFDTQIAAGFLGLSNPSLAILYQKYLGINLPKGDRMTNWLLRPLTEKQKSYAASDVAHLIEIYELQKNKLIELERISWVEDECVAFLEKESLRRSPDQAWRKIKELKRLKGRSKDVGRSVSRWREMEAARLDVPVKRVLSDLAIISISQQLPKSEHELRNIRGMESQKLRNGYNEAILDLVSNAPSFPEENTKEDVNYKNSDSKAAVSLITAYIYQLARDSEIDPSFIGTRNDIEALVAGETESKLMSGWRAELVGEAASKILSGKASLFFDGENRIVLEPRK